jgi:hypothetical protein
VPGNTSWLSLFSPSTVPYVTSANGDIDIILGSNVETGLFYSKAAFATAGITSTPTTWADFMTDLGKLKSAGVTPIMFADGGLCNPSYAEVAAIRASPVPATSWPGSCTRTSPPPGRGSPTRRGSTSSSVTSTGVSAATSSAFPPTARSGTSASAGSATPGYLLPVLSSAGHTDVAYRLLAQRTFPSWRYMIDRGATTIWERWDGWSEERGFQSAWMNSFNHYALGSVGEWLYRFALGIDQAPGTAGFGRLLLRPHPGGVA